MRVPIVDIGNSKGIRIPQAILKQVQFSKEIELDVSEGKITLRRSVDPSFVPDFASIARLDDLDIQRILRKISRRRPDHGPGRRGPEDEGGRLPESLRSGQGVRPADGGEAREGRRARSHDREKPQR